MTDPIEQLAKARAFVAENLPQLAREVCDWRNGHLLPEGARMLDLVQITAKWAGPSFWAVADHLVTAAALEEVARK